jgi:hypothetical protein
MSTQPREGGEQYDGVSKGGDSIPFGQGRGKNPAREEASFIFGELSTQRVDNAYCVG